MSGGAKVYAPVHIFEEKYREKSYGETISTTFAVCMYTCMCMYRMVEDSPSLARFGSIDFSIDFIDLKVQYISIKSCVSTRYVTIYCGSSTILQQDAAG